MVTDKQTSVDKRTLTNVKRNGDRCRTKRGQTLDEMGTNVGWNREGRRTKWQRASNGTMKHNSETKWSNRTHLDCADNGATK
jgi:hypothetical protein